jgi:hypothetical protein
VGAWEKREHEKCSEIFVTKETNRKKKNNNEWNWKRKFCTNKNFCSCVSAKKSRLENEKKIQIFSVICFSLCVLYLWLIFFALSLVMQCTIIVIVRTNKTNWNWVCSWKTNLMQRSAGCIQNNFSLLLLVFLKYHK